MELGAVGGREERGREIHKSRIKIVPPHPLTLQPLLCEKREANENEVVDCDGVWEWDGVQQCGQHRAQCQDTEQRQVEREKAWEEGEERSVRERRGSLKEG